MEVYHGQLSCMLRLNFSFVFVTCPLAIFAIHIFDCVQLTFQVSLMLFAIYLDLHCIQIILQFSFTQWENFLRLVLPQINRSYPGGYVSVLIEGNNHP